MLPTEAWSKPWIRNVREDAEWIGNHSTSSLSDYLMMQPARSGYTVS